MSGYQPKFTVSAESVNLISEISELMTRVELSNDCSDLKLRKRNRIKSIQSSLQIEANSLTVSQVTDIVDGST